MSRRNRNRSPASSPPGSTQSWLRRHAFWLSLGLVMVASVAGAYCLTQRPDLSVAAGQQPIAATVQRAFTLDKLLAMPPEQLKDVDIAEMNLLCAKGLPGAEKLDIAHCLATLDQWATRVQYETNRHLYRVTDPQWADHYRHSESYLRAELVLQVLQQDLGVKYDMAAKDNFAFNDSRVAFIHGMIPASGQSITETPGGTCASMPVMYVAVGRRLGYPLKLVTTKGHVFVRWDGKDHPNPAWRERFNIEGAGEGFSSFDDDYYKSWPSKLTDAEVKANGWLQSLTPMEEFAVFLASRGHCGMDNGQPTFAARCFENAYRYDTIRPCYRDWFVEAAMKCGYRPGTPALASLLKARMRPGGGNPEFAMAQQQAAARQEWLRTHPSDALASGLPNGIPGGGPSLPAPGVPQPPSPYGPQPGLPQPRQPYQPPTPGVPPRR